MKISPIPIKTITETKIYSKYIYSPLVGNNIIPLIGKLATKKEINF